MPSNFSINQLLPATTKLKIAWTQEEAQAFLENAPQVKTNSDAFDLIYTRVDSNPGYQNFRTLINTNNLITDWVQEFSKDPKWYLSCGNAGSAACDTDKFVIINTLAWSTGKRTVSYVYPNSEDIDMTWEDLESDGIFTVSFESAGGSLVSPYDNVEDGSKITVPLVPIKLFHTFQGWYTSSAYTDLWDFSTDLVEDHITLYAKWSSHAVRDVYLEGETDPLDKDVDSDVIVTLANTTDKNGLMSYQSLALLNQHEGRLDTLEGIGALVRPYVALSSNVPSAKAHSNVSPTLTVTATQNDAGSPLKCIFYRYNESTSQWVMISSEPHNSLSFVDTSVTQTTSGLRYRASVIFNPNEAGFNISISEPSNQYQISVLPFVQPTLNVGTPSPTQTRPIANTFTTEFVFSPGDSGGVDTVVFHRVLPGGATTALTNFTVADNIYTLVDEDYVSTANIGFRYRCSIVTNANANMASEALVVNSSVILSIPLAPTLTVAAITTSDPVQPVETTFSLTAIFEKNDAPDLQSIKFLRYINNRTTDITENIVQNGNEYTVDDIFTPIAVDDFIRYKAIVILEDSTELDSGFSASFITEPILAAELTCAVSPGTLPVKPLENTFSLTAVFTQNEYPAVSSLKFIRYENDNSTNITEGISEIGNEYTVDDTFVPSSPGDIIRYAVEATLENGLVLKTFSLTEYEVLELSPASITCSVEITGELQPAETDFYLAAVFTQGDQPDMSTMKFIRYLNDNPTELTEGIAQNGNEFTLTDTFTPPELGEIRYKASITLEDAQEIISEFTQTLVVGSLIDPTASLVINPATTSYTVGQEITPTLSLVTTQGNAGAIESLSIQRKVGSGDFLEIATTQPYQDTLTITLQTRYKAIVTFASGLFGASQVIETNEIVINALPLYKFGWASSIYTPTETTTSLKGTVTTNTFILAFPASKTVWIGVPSNKTISVFALYGTPWQQNITGLAFNSIIGSDGFRIYYNNSDPAWATNDTGNELTVIVS